MAMEVHTLERLIRLHIPDAVVSVRDLAGDGDHYAAEITSNAFRGKSRIEQHRMVYAALGTDMGVQLHALSLVTKIPD